MKRISLQVNNSWHESQEIELGVFSNETIAEDFAKKVHHLMGQDKFKDLLLSDFELNVCISDVTPNDEQDAWDALDNADMILGLRRS